MGHILANGYTAQRCGSLFSVYRGKTFVTRFKLLRSAKRYAETH